MPVFSIIIPAYNRADMIQRAIRSVLSQPFSGFELIVVDDGSTDNTASVIKGVEDTRMRYVNQANQGVSAARNKGASLAKGTYLIFLDSDDELNSGYFDEVHAALDKNPDVVFVGVTFFKDGKMARSVNPSYPYGKYSTDGLYLAGSFVVRADLFFAVGGYDTAIKYGENTELSLRLKPFLKNKIFIDKPLLRVFQETDTRTSNSVQNIIQSTEYMLKKHVDYYNANPHPRWLYHNVLAVAYIKMNSIEKGKEHLLQAIKAYPWRLRSYLRYLIVQVPLLRKRIYGG